ncbi:MAG: DNA recombination protein RmuC [Alphaproteobacteria bacterium MarineAlpha5_Bin5]|nr:MAG: DNA recombination protein RmuC [Alphaproteobacteria bacterium MarineAlpha5_Bin4]PPR51090.1 MAG: DNA recombination protein RmuC [Alphaproteobacteria bacterium MarineAlpha5_Bin5]|tara:strand:- start:530 stop:1495 length:966 start_codon:yes stop_codon:yes gene_type:complete
MEFSNQVIVFLVGFFCGVGVLTVLYFIKNSKKYKETEEDENLISLRNHMNSIQQSLQNFNLAQDRIENTLIRGGAQQQGPWGEFVLKNILDSVGLREGEEYETQKAFRDSEGNFQKPDVVVRMPGNRDIVIDSKVSLNAWHDYSNTNDEIKKNTYLKKFLDSVKVFVKDLSKDNYENIYEINTVDNVLMFIPIEPALLTLYNEGIKIVEDAWQKKIIIVGPSTLPFLLKTIENMWRIDKQTKTIKEIAASATEIYDKTVTVYDSFIQANQSLEKAKSKMEEAKLRLQDGPGSLTKKVNKMKKLGRLNTKKELPDGMEDDIN